mmetsp:Transcript_41195/g.117524  ORF Transcript_41195/g.117524 Transcript_41195/m.117524 type:complete len:295 (+) Transcript_41195:637-1521(+)
MHSAASGSTTQASQCRASSRSSRPPVASTSASPQVTRPESGSTNCGRPQTGSSTCLQPPVTVIRCSMGSSGTLPAPGGTWPPVRGLASGCAAGLAADGRGTRARSRSRGASSWPPWSSSSLRLASMACDFFMFSVSSRIRSRVGEPSIRTTAIQPPQRAREPSSMRESCAREPTITDRPTRAPAARRPSCGLRGSRSAVTTSTASVVSPLGPGRTRKVGTVTATMEATSALCSFAGKRCSCRLPPSFGKRYPAKKVPITCSSLGSSSSTTPGRGIPTEATTVPRLSRSTGDPSS